MPSPATRKVAAPIHGGAEELPPWAAPGDILAIATSSDPWSPAVSVAIALAARWGSRLTGCYIAPSLRRVAAADMEPSMLGMLVQPRGEDDGERDAFAAHARRLGVAEAEWMATHAGLAPTLRALGAWHDLAVLERDVVEGTRLFDVLSEAMANSRLPCLLLPPGWNGGLEPGRVVVAWNGSIEATRAIHGALPFLQAATEVLLLDGGERGADADDDARRVPRFDPLDYLWRHRVTARSQPIHAPPQEAGMALLQAARGIRAELLVMGSYSHSQLRERILGGATGHVLAHAHLPVLMQH